VAARDIEAMLEVPGIDVFFIGPVDLAKSLGYHGDYRHLDVAAEIERLIDRIHAAGRVTIEKHGKAVEVVLSTEDYRDFEALKLARLRSGIQVGLDDIAAGRVVDAETAFADARKLIDELPA